MRVPAELTFPVHLRRGADQPLHEQIAGQVGAAMRQGLLAADARLPSTRALAEQLGVSRGVTAAAYDLLSAQGRLRTRPGSGSYPNPPLCPGRTPAVPAAAAAEPIDLRAGPVCPELVPVAAWRSAWREATFRRPPAGAPPTLGLPELRAAVAEHVTRTRGIPPAGRTVVITGGAAAGLRALLGVLGVDGARVALEEPASPAVRRAAGAPAALPVDADGPRFDRVPAGCAAVVCSSDGQAPLGHLMAADRRAEAAAWARRTGGHVIDVAGDMVLSGPARRMPQLLNLLDGGGTLLGDVCPALGPALRVGYALVPADLAAALGRYLADGGDGATYVAQRTMAALLRDGTVNRLAHRLDRLRDERGAAVEAALGRLRGIRHEPRAATGTAVLHLPPRVDAGRVARYLLARGVRVGTSADCHFSGRPVPPALVLGCLRPAAADLPRALATVREALDGAR